MKFLFVPNDETKAVGEITASLQLGAKPIRIEADTLREASDKARDELKLDLSKGTFYVPVADVPKEINTALVSARDVSELGLEHFHCAGDDLEGK